MARSFRRAVSRCASADFTPFPLSAFGAMAEVAGEIGGVVVLVATGGGALLSFGFGKKGRAAEIFRERSSNRRSGETAPVSPAYKEGGGGRFALPNKETTHNLSHDAAFDVCRWGGRGGYRVRYGVPQAAHVPVPYFGPGPTALGTVCDPGPGAPVGVLK